MDPIVPLIVALLGGGGITAWINFRKAPAEREAITVGTMGEVIDTLRAEVARKDGEIVQLRTEADDLRRQVVELLRRVTALESRPPSE
mgnify:CR=1 FL=1